MCCWRRSRWRRSRPSPSGAATASRPGAPVATLESADAEIAVAQAEAALAQAQAQLADLQVGKRPEEIAVLEGGARHRPRRRPPRPSAHADRDPRPAQARHRHAGAIRRRDHAAPKSAEAAGRPGRSQSRRRPAAGAPGDDQGRRKPGQAGASRTRPGALAAVASARSPRPRPAASTTSSAIPATPPGPTAPVISMLPDGAVKLSVYVPEAAFSSVKVGTLLDVRCDGCGPDLKAQRQLCLARPGIHPAGDLFARDPAEAGLPGRGAARKATPARCSRARSSMWELAKWRVGNREWKAWFESENVDDRSSLLAYSLFPIPSHCQRHALP